MSVKLLTEHCLEFKSLKTSCTGSSVSTLVILLHCWNSDAVAHLYCLFLSCWFLTSEGHPSKFECITPEAAVTDPGILEDDFVFNSHSLVFRL